MEFYFIGHQMVGWSDNNIGILAAALNMICSIGNAWRSVSPCWFTKHLVWAQHGQMFQNELLISFVGNYEKILVRNDGTETLVGSAYETFSCA